MHLVAGGTAGFIESSICHPLDTIKTRMQLRRQAQGAHDRVQVLPKLVVVQRHDGELAGFR